MIVFWIKKHEGLLVGSAKSIEILKLHVKIFYTHSNLLKFSDFVS